MDCEAMLSPTLPACVTVRFDGPHGCERGV
jgi:hypothetical protein